MKPLCDYHIHTTFSDGKNTPEEMVIAAIKKGVSEIGFSDHSYTSFDEECCISLDKIVEYKREIARLKEKYKDKIKIFCGIEQDYYSVESTEDYDYVIGSVHYVKKNGKYLAVDESAEDFVKNVQEFFGGDYYEVAKEYFNAVASFAERKEIDIIGHFDLVSKFNEKGKYFDETDERYVIAWKTAADKIINRGKVFEINTGAISKGYKTQPYPSDAIRDYIKANGGKFILSSDSHSKETICFEFEKYGI